MKRHIKSFSMLAVIAVMLVSAFGASAQEPSDSVIRVSGFGTAYATPDIAYLSIGVEVANEDVQVAVNDANSRVDAIRAVLSEKGVSADDVRTENFFIYRETIYDNGIPTDRGLFRVNNYLRITVRDTAQVPELLSVTLEAGATTVNNVSFGIDDPSSLESEARQSAIENARAKAEELAGLVGATLGDVRSVSEYGGTDPNFPMYNMGIGGGGGGGGITPPSINSGSLAVSVNVEVTFELVSE